MKLASFRTRDRETYGVLDGEQLREPGGRLLASYPTLRSALAADVLADIGADQSGSSFAVNKVEFLPLIPQPDKVLCVGANYRPHIEEMGREPPEHPMIFVRFPGSQTGHGQALLRPGASEQFDFEGELAIVIGRPARHVPRERAFDVIAGYSCFMDGTVRDWQRHTAQFTPGKNFAKSGSFGPYLVTADEVPDLGSQQLTTHVNGELMQQGWIRELVFDIPALVEYCSTFTELLPGDVIATGTPGGVGAARTPPSWLSSGDRVDVRISAVGELSNKILDE
ncbi:MAG: fumarylacetoacetate hydrolase family protein [Gammaproteobacteria bacterium]|nr:fumarylacetoacetate hydrolase family protein [Gammaproteobacteria bacterium]